MGGVSAHRFTVDDYFRMTEVGVLARDARVELIRGSIIDMPSIGTPHLRMVNRLTKLLVTALGDRATVSVQNPLPLDTYSEPEPDVVLLLPEHDDDDATRPAASDALLVIEVADSSLGYDRSVKTPLYAEFGVPEYWIVDLEARAVDVHRRPEGGEYRDVARAVSGTLAIERLPGVEIALAALFKSDP